MRIIKALIQSYIWIGLGAACTYYYSATMISGLEFNPVYVLLIFSSTTCLYTILGNFKRTLNTGAAIKIGISGLISISALWELADYRVFMLLIPSVIVGVFYGYKGGLRRVPYLKVFLIALIWVYTTTFVPLVISDVVFESAQFYFMLSMVLFLLGITIPFDVRDIYFDSPSIKTLPQVMGEKQSILLSVICVAMSGLMTIYLLNQGVLLITNYLIMLWFPISLLAVGCSKNSRPSLYFTGLLDGLLVLQGILAFLVS